tara:strand:- start:31 stop:240 length:210 start_codon:yes stop_codon:yes gene_type:complete
LHLLKLKKGNNMSILIKIISWFFVIAGFIILTASAGTSDRDGDLVLVIALAIVGLAAMAFGAVLLRRDD